MITYFSEIPDFLAFQVLCVDMFAYFVVIDNVPNLLHAYFGHTDLIHAFFDLNRHILTIEASYKTADQAHQK